MWCVAARCTAPSPCPYAQTAIGPLSIPRARSCCCLYQWRARVPATCQCVRVVAWRPRRSRVYECRRRHRRGYGSPADRPRRRRDAARRTFHSPRVYDGYDDNPSVTYDTLLLPSLRRLPLARSLARTLARARPSVRTGGESERARGWEKGHWRWRKTYVMYVRAARSQLPGHITSIPRRCRSLRWTLPRGRCVFPIVRCTFFLNHVPLKYCELYEICPSRPLILPRSTSVYPFLDRRFPEIHMTFFAREAVSHFDQWSKRGAVSARNFLPFHS